MVYGMVWYGMVWYNFRKGTVVQDIEQYS
jgi:hypothetical protein